MLAPWRILLFSYIYWIKTYPTRGKKAWSMERGAWGRRHGAWSVEHGEEGMEHGAWSMGKKAWSMVRGAWGVRHSEGSLVISGRRANEPEPVLTQSAETMN
jgi:argininosuccinate synthase